MSIASERCSSLSLEHARVLMRFAERRLDDPALRPATVAAAHRISVRHLHRLFSLAGQPFGDWLRAHRLERCRADLASPALGGLGIGEIAYRWGFNDAAHFSRSFKQAFGLSPRAYRRGELISA